MYAKDEAPIETEPSRLESYGEREDLLDEEDYNVYDFRNWFKENEEFSRGSIRTKIFLDFLSNYPEQQPELKSGPFSKVFISELEEEIKEEYFYLGLTYHDYLLNNEEEYFNNNHDMMMDLEEDFGPMAANSIINAIVKKYKWVRDLDKKVREIRDLTYVKGEYEGIKFKVGFSLDDDYASMVELCLRGFPVFSKIEYKRSENQSEVEVRIVKNGRFEAALYSKKDFDDGDDKDDIDYGDDKDNIDYGAFARYIF
jgi:hypothetical protein|tara:strand:- start:31 stop:795 length:765 start_codon:yes stop_codon:yes gene_type:complete